jgi:hypothetical protein
LLVFHLQRHGGEFAAKQREFFAEQRRDYIVPNRNGDTTGGLDRAGAAASAWTLPSYRSLPRSDGIALAKRVFPVLYEVRYRKLAQRDCRPLQQEIKS